MAYDLKRNEVLQLRICDRLVTCEEVYLNVDYIRRMIDLIFLEGMNNFHIL